MVDVQHIRHVARMDDMYGRHAARMLHDSSIMSHFECHCLILGNFLASCLPVESSKQLCLQVCVAGWSMGGIHACMVASLSRYPIACAAVMPPRSAAVAFCNGTLSDFVDVRELRSSSDNCGTPVLGLLAQQLDPDAAFPNQPTVFATHPAATLVAKQPHEAAGPSGRPMAPTHTVTLAVCFMLTIMTCL
jgi:Alpha/beta hydrolase domain containing 18